MSIDRAEIEKLLALPEEELFAMMGQQIVDQAIECLNEALRAHGSNSQVVADGQTHALTDFIDESKVQDVLLSAREAAEARHLAVGERGDVADVMTVDQAVDYILGNARIMNA